MGFGTGHHATTRLALKALQDLPLEGRAVLDIGCGSGVLAIAAIKLGAASAVAIDVDPDALDNARENAVLNGVASAVQFAERDFRTWTDRADIVTANLTGALIAQSAQSLMALVGRGGHLVASGFTNQQSGSVLSALETVAVLQKLECEDEWICAVFAEKRG
jgi:ribosomal protein L11 methyltransferase